MNLPLHTTPWPQTSCIPICWYRRGRYCFRFIIQSKSSLHRLSVWNPEVMTWPDLPTLHGIGVYIGVVKSHGVKRWAFYCSNVTSPTFRTHNLQNIKIHVLRCSTNGFNIKHRERSDGYSDCIGHPQCSALHPTRLVASLHQTTGGKYIGFFFIKYGVNTQWMDLSPVQTFV